MYIFFIKNYHFKYFVRGYNKNNLLRLYFVLLNKVIFCNFDKFTDKHTELIRLNTPPPPSKKEKHSLIGKKLMILIKHIW